MRKPYTLDELDLPQYLTIGGRRVEIILDPSLMEIRQNDPKKAIAGDEPFNQRGVWGRARIKENQIILWPGNDGWVPPIEKIKAAFWEEVVHFILFVTHANKANLTDGYLWRNEFVVGIISELFYQVYSQLCHPIEPSS